MKRLLLNPVLCLTVLTSIHSSVFAQWCVPGTIIPYNQNMPGITHVLIGSIDRTSSDLENYPYNSYVNTGLTTDLILGNTYTISVTHTIDGSICPDMNIRVWIDYNQDYSFDDAGETVISTDHHLPGTYTGTFTVPLTAASGTTRMRVTAKMSSAGGHTLPTPCDFPADPFGYHGEMEDYNVTLLNTTGVHFQNSDQFNLSVYPSMINDHAKISFRMKANSAASLRLCNAVGEIVWINNVIAITPGMQEIELEDKTINQLGSGVYFIQLITDSGRQAKRIVIL